MIRAAAASAIPALGVLSSCTAGKDTPGVRYTSALRGILGRIRDEEHVSIRNAANLFAKTILSRNLCFLASSQPSLPGYLNEDSPGLPRVFVFLRSKEMAGTIRPSDVVFDTTSGEFDEIIRASGAQTAGLCMPSIPRCASAQDRKLLVAGEEFGAMAGTVIRSHLPVWDGLVNLQEYQFGILPGSGPVELTMMTALAGEAYRRSERAVRIEHVRARDALEFIMAVERRIELLEKQADTARRAAETIAKKLLNRGVLWVYDRRGGLDRELAGGAGTPAFARAITPREITDGTLRPIDALIFASIESNHPEDLHTIRMARGVTNAIVAVCPREERGGYRIYNEAPYSLDNVSPEKDGIKTFDNESRTFLHTGGILNSAVFWMLVGEVAGKLIGAGRIPQFFMGSHLAGSAEHNAGIRTKFERGEW